jgi:hypothetical protein
VNLAKVRKRTLALLVLSTVTVLGCQALVRKMMFYPTHHAEDRGFAHWMHEGRLIGFSRPVENPQNVWLLLHGNGGQAANLGYAMPAFADRDAVFILEYPGYGSVPGNCHGRASMPRRARPINCCARNFPASPSVLPPSRWAAARARHWRVFHSRRTNSCSSCLSTT